MREIRIETRIRESRIKIICLRHVPTPVHKTVSRPMVDDNLYPGIEEIVDDIERERVRERGEIYTAVDRLGSGSPLLALEDLCNLISG